jgi:hypothetical protein
MSSITATDARPLADGAKVVKGDLVTRIQHQDLGPDVLDAVHDPGDLVELAVQWRRDKRATGVAHEASAKCPVAHREHHGPSVAITELAG